MALGSLEAGENGLVVATTGCHARGQRVIAFDGREVAVEDVRVGDLLMGPDSRPRRVLGLIRGRGKMHRICPVKGAPWVVSEDHVLSLVDTRQGATAPFVDVSVKEWLSWPPGRVHLHKLVRCSVSYPPHQEAFPIPPYHLGVLIGDGCLGSSSVSVTKPDPEIRDACVELSEMFGLRLRESANTSGCPTYHFVGRGGLQNPLASALSTIGLRCVGEYRRIPESYLLASRVDRLAMLAGLLDTDGHLAHSGYDWISKSRGLAHDVVRLARSLGLAAYVKECEKRCQNGGGGTYWRVSISGDATDLPLRIPRKQALPRRQKKSVLRTGFRIEDAGVDDYFGFTLDDDQRYLLDDFTVTHNSGKSIFMAEVLRRWRQKHPPSEGVVVVTTPTKKLVQQLSATLSDVLGASVVGQFYTAAKQDKREVVVCCNASVPLLAARLKATGRTVAVWIADEAHRTNSEGMAGDLDAEVIAGALNAERRLGMTATPGRASDKDTLVLYDKVIYTYTPADALRDGVIVPARYVIPDEYEQVEDVDPWLAKRILSLGTRAERGPGVVDAANIKDAEAYAAFLATYGLQAGVIHSRMAEDAQQQNIRRLKDGQLDCLVHVSMLVEGVDLPWLKWLGVRRDTESRVRWIQQIGRILRAFPGKTEAIILDPMALSLEFAPTFPASLGWPDEEEEQRVADEIVAKEEREIKNPLLSPEKREIARVRSICRYVRALRNALASEGVDTGNHRSWFGMRQDPASGKQVAALEKMRGLFRRVGAPHGQALLRLASTKRVLTMGSASDMMDIATGLKAVTSWSPAHVIPVPPESAFVPPTASSQPLYAGVAMRNGRVAAVATRAGEMVFSKVREKRDGDTPRRVLVTFCEGLIAARNPAVICISDLTVTPYINAGLTELRQVEGSENPAVGAAWAALYRDAKAAAVA